MVLIKIESLSQKELEHIAVQEGVRDAASMSRDELIETLREIYEDESDDSQMGGEDNIQRKFVTWLTDYRGEGSELTSLPGVVDLPDLYNETSIHLLTKNATWLYCYWSIANFDREKFDAEYSRYRFLINVRLFNDDEVLDSYDIDISDSDVEWNINVNTSALHAQVSLVLVADEKERKTLVSSETVDLVSIYWLNHRNEISGNEALLRRELSLLTNRDGYILPSESVESIVQCIREEENL